MNSLEYDILHCAGRFRIGRDQCSGGNANGAFGGIGIDKSCPKPVNPVTAVEGNRGMRSINNWQYTVNALAHNKGFYEGGVDLNRSLLLAIGELVEAQNELRNGRAPTELYFSGETGAKPEGFGVEIVDCIIRLMDTAQELGIDLEYLMTLKHEYNEGRSHKHGKSF